MLLSTVRKHDIQALMLARQALEAVPLACYALSQQAFAASSIGKDGKDVAEALRRWEEGKQYKWLATEFPDRSENIKRLKSKINDYYTHAGVYSAQTSLSIDFQGNMVPEFFDQRDDKFVAGRIGLCADLALRIADLLAAVVEKYPGAVRLVDGFNATYNAFEAV